MFYRCFFALMIGLVGQSQIQQLDEVVLRAQRINSTIQPLSASIISDSLQLLLQQDIGERLNVVPSLFVSSQQNFTQDTRISIRGYGARAAFGIRGIKILLDGIPVTTPDGQTQLDHIPLSQLGTIEVLRGLSGGLYGNASGGVILLKSAAIKSKKNIAVSIADFNAQSLVATASEANEKNQFRFIAEHKKQTGYRAWSGYENSLISLSNAILLSKEKRLTFDYSFFRSPFARDAGGLTTAEVVQNRKQARQANLDYKAGEKVSQHHIAARLKTNTWNAYAFYTTRQLDANLPFAYGGQIDLGRNYAGLGAHRNGTKNQWKWIYGVETAAQLDSRMRFKNNLGDKGEQTLNQDEHFYSVGGYGIVETYVADWHIRGSLRTDTHWITLTDILGSNSGDTTLSALSSSVAVHRKMSNTLNGYIRWGTGFETPSLNELSANPTGKTGFNTSLNPQKSEEFEIGFRYAKNRLNLGLVVFYTTTKDEILSYEIEQFPSQTFYTNIGRTRRKGVELEGTYSITKNTQLDFAHSHGSYQTDAGKDLPNIPKTQFNMGLKHNYNKGIFGTTLRHTSERFAENANQIKVPSFWIADVYFQRSLGNINATVGVTNLGNARYFDNIRINAFGGRYFEPASERQAYFRLNLSL